MARNFDKLCSSIQPTLNLAPQQSPEQRKAVAIKLMETDGDFDGSECIPVLWLFTSSIDIVDSYLAIADRGIRTLFIKGYLPDPL